MIASTPEEVMKREWHPVADLSAFSRVKMTELFVWPGKANDPWRRTCCCVAIGGELFVIVRDGEENIRQAWMVG